MLISSEKEQIFLPSDGAEDSLKSSPTGSGSGSGPDSLDGFSPVSLLPDSTPLPSSYTDVNVVPEHRKNELEQFISNLEGEIVQLKLKEKLLNEKRRASLNKILDIKGSIRIFCRVRPFHSTNQRRRVHEPVSTGLDKIAVKSAGIGKEFRFDKVFHQVASQDDVFVEVEPILRSALDGHNVCIVAYGQTGTGKTFTMDGSNDQPGIVPRALEELFCQASLDNSVSVTFSMSMLEVYMGNLKDLLAMRPSCRTYEPVSRCNLNIQTDPKGLVEVEGLTEVQIPDISKAKWWYSKGRRARSTSWTTVNDASSRSHCLTRITIFRRSNPLEAKAEVSKLWMVDLGGSERLLKTGATGQTLDEGRAINLSLSALGDVIAALRRKKGHVPYRNSKLTQILKDSLGYGSKVLMLVHVSPYEDDVGETICSLSFAYRARAIESNREVPEDLKKQRERRISEIEEEMREMEEQCQKIRNQIKNAEFLLSENKGLFSISYGVCEDDDKIARTPKEDLLKITESPRISDETIKRNTTDPLPRFMTSTVASRQRHSASEREIIGRARTVRSETRSSVQFSASQSLSYSDIRSRAILRNSSKKSQHVEAKALLNSDGPKFSNLDFKTTSMPKSKIVISSDPNLRVTLGRHRRRMSDLI